MNHSLHPTAGEGWHNGYKIRVKGCLSDEILSWLDVPTSVDPDRGETCLFITPPDQAALYGMILHLRDLSLTLLSVEWDSNDRRK